jgi:predicted XRE-type DNA-binding protein
MQSHTTHTFACIWDAIEPEPGRAAVLRMRSALLLRMQTHFQALGFTPRTLATLARIPLHCSTALLAGKLSVFSTERLIEIAQRAGLAVTLEVREASDAPFGSPTPGDRS